jgi:hypothetical protein
MKETRRTVGSRWTWVAWAMLAVAVVSMVFGLLLGVANGTLQPDAANQVMLFLGFSAFMVVGALIVAHRPGNAIGWLFSAVGLLAFTGQVAGQYALYAYVTRPGSLPGAILAAWFDSWTWYVVLALVVVFTPFLFPTGRLLSPRWRPAAWLAAAATAAVALLGALRADLDSIPEHEISNPIGVAGVENPEKTTIGVAFYVLLGFLAALAIWSLVLRFRRSRGEERQQLKWFTYAAALLLPGSLVSDFVPGALGTVVGSIPIVFVPVAAGIAILRYRLYDIDRLINRTWSAGCSPPCWLASTAARFWFLGRGSAGSVANRHPGRWPAPPWPWQPCSSRPADASSRRWIDASTAASTTRPRRLRPSAPGCGRRSTWTRCQRNCWRWWTKRCSRARHGCGFDLRLNRQPWAGLGRERCRPPAGRPCGCRELRTTNLTSTCAGSGDADAVRERRMLPPAGSHGEAVKRAARLRCQPPRRRPC